MNTLAPCAAAPVPTRRPLALTMGDAAGIGPEILARLFACHAPACSADALVVGDVQTMRRATALVAEVTGQASVPVATIRDAREALDVPPRCMPVLQVGTPLGLVPHGQVDARAGAFAGNCVCWAADAALRGDVSAMVTAPLHKAALNAAGAPFDQFAGHTELLQARAAQFLGLGTQALPVRMMLANPELRVILLSIHVSLREALDAVTVDNIVQTLVIAHRALAGVLGRAPRFLVAGLNPHAGESGLFGREELDVIAPAIANARALGIAASGPWPPDTVFMQARAARAGDAAPDAVIALYHDQGLIPVKYLGVEHGVNVTLGLPFVRTSPDHGTAFDIAGRGIADDSSLLAAVHLARAYAAPTPTAVVGTPIS